MAIFPPVDLVFLNGFLPQFESMLPLYASCSANSRSRITNKLRLNLAVKRKQEKKDQARQVCLPIVDSALRQKEEEEEEEESVHLE